MSFFRRDEEPDTTTPARRPASPSTPSAGTGPGSAQQVTRIAGGTRITGEVSGTTELLIEGEVDGLVRLDSRVVVGQAGGVKGEIQARAVRIDGRVEGPVRGSERVEVGPTGRLEGDIRAPRVTIAEGAFFKGKVEMGGDERRSGPASKPERGGRDDRRDGGSRHDRKDDPDDSPGLFPGGPGTPAGPGDPGSATGASGATGVTGGTGASGGTGGTGAPTAKDAKDTNDGGRGGRA
jgi:cytoskeletal protein CcmA (bactofilin family)